MQQEEEEEAAEEAAEEEEQRRIEKGKGQRKGKATRQGVPAADYRLHLARQGQHQEELDEPDEEIYSSLRPGYCVGHSEGKRAMDERAVEEIYASLHGPGTRDGSDGGDGADGADGAAGADGADGADGDDGDDGGGGEGRNMRADVEEEGEEEEQQEEGTREEGRKIVILHGSLQKRSSSLPYNWQTRHFVLSEEHTRHCLAYYKDARDSRPVLKEFDLGTPNTLAFGESLPLVLGLLDIASPAML
jgi:hypothetical protein